MLQFHLNRPQTRMKAQAYKHQVEKEFQVGELMYVKLQPYRQSSVALRTCHKLATKYFGPFLVITRAGKVTYRL